MNVYLRDTQHLVEVLLVAWFWAIPGVYAFSGRVHDRSKRHTILFIPHTKLIWLYFANPVTPGRDDVPARLLQHHPLPELTRLHTDQANGRTVTYHAVHPPPWPSCPTTGSTGTWVPIWPSSAVSILLFLGALVVFGHLEGNFAEEL